MTISLAILAAVILVVLVVYLSLLKPAGTTLRTALQQASEQQLSEPAIPGAGLPTAQPTKDDDDDNY